MEALLAVGLAGNIVQFVQFAGKLISEAHSIKRTGNPSSIPDLKILAETLTKESESIHETLKGSNATLSKDDQVC